jgi:hypothetical protein
MHWACLLAVTGKFIPRIVTGIDVWVTGVDVVVGYEYISVV